MVPMNAQSRNCSGSASYQFQRPFKGSENTMRRILIAVSLVLASSFFAESDLAQGDRSARLPAPDSKSTSGDWVLWGGPHRDFVVSASGLAASWPDKGPRRLWSRQLGDGYSSVAIEGTTLYTT